MCEVHEVKEVCTVKHWLQQVTTNKSSKQTHGGAWLVNIRGTTS